MSVPQFEPESLQAICDAIGNTTGGLTGSEIGRLLAQSGIADSDISTKRHRLFDALNRRQTQDGSGNNVVAFLQRLMAPVRWVARTNEWMAMRDELDAVLSFSGLAIDDSGKLVAASLNTTVFPAAPVPAPEPPSPEVIREQRRRQELAALLDDFSELASQLDRQDAGHRLERLLTSVFAMFDLEPHASFRVIGEEIDGSFILDGETYLLEAKWTRGPVGESDLLVFRGKVEGKSAFTRGVFVSISGYSLGSQEAIVRGKTPNFVMIDGTHLHRVLSGHASLSELLRQLVRRLGETGTPYVPVSQLE